MDHIRVGKCNVCHKFAFNIKVASKLYWSCYLEFAVNGLILLMIYFNNSFDVYSFKHTKSGVFVENSKDTYLIALQFCVVGRAGN